MYPYSNNQLKQFLISSFDSHTQTHKPKTNWKPNAGKNENVNLNGFGDNRQFNEEKSYLSQRYESKIPLKLVMDPRGVVQDVHTQGISYDHSGGMLSPDKCAELVSALQSDSPKGKGWSSKLTRSSFILLICRVKNKIVLNRCWTLCQETQAFRKMDCWRNNTIGKQSSRHVVLSRTHTNLWHQPV